MPSQGIKLAIILTEKQRGPIKAVFRIFGGGFTKKNFETSKIDFMHLYESDKHFGGFQIPKPPLIRPWTRFVASYCY